VVSGCGDAVERKVALKICGIIPRISSQTIYGLKETTILMLATVTTMSGLRNCGM